MKPADAFLADILANPGDDFPRLAHADWLEEQGQGERADFIRVQCELAQHKQDRCPNHPDPLLAMQCGKCRWCLLKAQEGKLLQRAWQWAPEVIQHGIDRVWRRGFLEAVSCSGSLWIQAAPVLLAAHPVQEVTLLSLPVVTRGPHYDRLYLYGTDIWCWKDEGCDPHFLPGAGQLFNEIAAPLLLHRGWPTIRFQGPDILQIEEINRRWPVGKPPDYLLDHARKLHPVPTALPWRQVRKMPKYQQPRPWRSFDLLCPCGHLPPLTLGISQASVTEMAYQQVRLDRVEFYRTGWIGSDDKSSPVERFTHYLGQCQHCKTVHWTGNCEVRHP